MTALAIVGGSSYRKHRSFRRQSQILRAAIEALESRQYLTVPVVTNVFLGAGAFTENGDCQIAINASDPDQHPITSLQLDWGDGSDVENYDSSEFTHGTLDTDDGEVSGWLFDHNYMDNGSYTLTVTPTDGDNESASYTFAMVVLNLIPEGTLSNSGPVNEGQQASVSFNDATDASPIDTEAGLRYSFATDPDDLATTYNDAGTDSSASIELDDSGVHTIYGRVFDKDDGYADDSTNVNVVNVAPTATLSTSQSETGFLRAQFSNVYDPSPADASHGFKYAFSTNYNSLLSVTYSQASTTPYADFDFSDSGTQTVYARIFDQDGSRPYDTTLSLPPLSVAVASSSQINLTWTDTATGETGWRVQRSTNGTTFSDYVNLAPDTEQYEATGLDDGTRYWFRVRAYGTPGTASDTIYSPKMAATTQLPAPVNVVASNTNNATNDIVVTWDSASQHQTGFVIKRYAPDVDVDTATPLETVSVGANARTYTFTNLPDNPLFQFAVSAENEVTFPIISLHPENRTEPTSAWTTAYQNSLEQQPFDIHANEGYSPGVAATWSPTYILPNGPSGINKEVMDPLTSGQTVTIDLSGLPRHTYARVSVTIYLWITQHQGIGLGTPTITARAGGHDLDILSEDLGATEGEIELGIGPNGLGRPDAFKHESSRMEITLTLGGLTILENGHEAAYWQPGNVAVDTYFPFVTISGNGIVSEDNIGAAFFTVQRTGDTGSVVLNDPLTVLLHDAAGGYPGTAEEGTDYEYINAITINSEQTLSTKPVIPIDDAIIEGTEWAYLSIMPDRTDYGLIQDPATAPTTNYSTARNRIIDDKLRIDLSLMGSPGQHIVPSPENEDYVWEKMSAWTPDDDLNVPSELNGTDALGALPMGWGRSDYPGVCYVAPVMVVGQITSWPLEYRQNNLELRWWRQYVAREWLIKKVEGNSPGSYKWVVQRISGDEEVVEDSDTSDHFNDPTPSDSGWKIYSYDSSGVNLDNRGFDPVNEYIYFEKAFVYGVDAYVSGNWDRNIATMPVGQIITAKKTSVGGSVATDWQGIENTNAIRELDVLISQEKVRAIVNDDDPIEIDADAND